MAWSYARLRDEMRDILEDMGTLGALRMAAGVCREQAQLATQQGRDIDALIWNARAEDMQKAQAATYQAHTARITAPKGWDTAGGPTDQLTA